MREKFSEENKPSKEALTKFKLLLPMLSSLLEELKEFSKKKPDGVLNKFKITTINRTLKDVKDILSYYPSNQYLDLLDDETLPQNSDAVLVLGQYKAAMDHFKKKFYRWNGSNHGWETSSGFLPDREFD